MYKKILAPLDGSKVSERILPYAQLWARSFGIPIELLAVVEPETIASSTADHERRRQILTAEKSKVEYLKTITGTVPAVSACGDELGNPAEVIVDRPANDPETLIAIGTHGRSGIQRWLLGSVAEKVLRAARNPVLIVRTAEATQDTQALSFRSVLVPLDGSELAESVLPHAAELSGKMNLEIVLVRVFNIPADYYDEGYTADERVWEMVRDEAREYLDKKVKELKSQGLENVSSVLLEGFAAERIITLAQETPQSLIAICTHGRTGARRWVLGSVTERVVRHSGDPVLVIRAPDAVS